MAAHAAHFICHCREDSRLRPWCLRSTERGPCGAGEVALHVCGGVWTWRGEGVVQNHWRLVGTFTSLFLLLAGRPKF